MTWLIDAEKNNPDPINSDKRLLSLELGPLPETDQIQVDFR
jgi:hypothetical protein